MVGYELKYSGTCSESSDFNWITSEKECKVAGKALEIQNPNPKDRSLNGLPRQFLTTAITVHLLDHFCLAVLVFSTCQ